MQWICVVFVALREEENDGKTKGVASELQDDGAEAEDAEDDEAADPAARGSNEDAAAINEKLWLWRNLGSRASRVEVDFVWLMGLDLRRFFVGVVLVFSSRRSLSNSLIWF